jgi:hypothetical protein
MVASISEREWTEPSQNPGWTNGQIVFHILLGFILVMPLTRLLVFFGRLPALCSRIFAGILNLSTPLFNRINAMGPRAGARLLGRGSSPSSIRSMAPFSRGSIERALPIGQRQCTIRPVGTRASKHAWTWRPYCGIRLTIYDIIEISCGPPNKALSLTSAAWQNGAALAG